MKRWFWLGLAAIAWLHCRDQPMCELAQHWHVPPPHYDYFQSIQLDADGTGELAMGEGQMVRAEVKVRYRVEPGAIRFEYVQGSEAATRAIRFRVEEGDFIVEEPDYDRRR